MCVCVMCVCVCVCVCYHSGSEKTWEPCQWFSVFLKYPALLETLSDCLMPEYLWGLNSLQNAVSAFNSSD